MDAKKILEEAQEIEEEIIPLRRKIHENPELSYQEFETAQLVRKYLEGLGIETKVGVGLPTAVVGVVRGKEGGETVALRADMDALPVSEETNLPFSSRRPGVMHAVWARCPRSHAPRCCEVTDQTCSRTQGRGETRLPTG